MAVWLNGERIEGSVAPFDLTDRGLTLGDGVFDTALVLGGRTAFRNAHLKRLGLACETLGFALDLDRAGETMDAAAADAGVGSVRLTTTRGSGPRGIAPPAEVCPTTIATNASGPAALAFSPMRLWPSPIRRNETSPASRLKTLGYLDAVIALGEARRNGFDEALFLNTSGSVACAGTGNVFVLKGDVLATPALAEGVLPGIVRGTVLRLAARLGLQVAERKLEPESLSEADAVFVTNSLRLIAPVTAIGERPIAGGRTAVLRRLADALCREIGQDCAVDPGLHLHPDRLGS